jgi:siroheme synthase-like protein
MTDLLPLFLHLTGRRVVLVGGGRVAASKLRQLRAAGAHVRVVAPEIDPAIASVDGEGVELVDRGFESADLDDAWLVVAAATPSVNREVAAAAEQRRLFVNAVDDPANASAFLGGVVRRDGVTIAVSTSGDAPALAALVKEGLDALLPRDLEAWIGTARDVRVNWRRAGIPMDERKPLLLRALNDLYRRSDESGAGLDESGARLQPCDLPEDSWL